MNAPHPRPQPPHWSKESLGLDRTILSWIDDVERHSASLPGLWSPEPAERRAAQRQLSDRLAVEYTIEAPAGVSIDDIAIEAEGMTVHVRRYRSVGENDSASGDIPTQLFLHGGGFVSGSEHELVNDRILAHRAAQTGIQFFSLRYRLAPEHPYPAAVDDTISAIRGIFDQATALGVDATRFGLAGNSAGAGIAASATLRWRDEDVRPLRHLALEVPATSLRPVGESAQHYRLGFGLDDAERLAESYLPDGVDDDGYSSPLDYQRLAGHPNTLVMTAEHDPLRDGGELYASRLTKAGVPVILIRGGGHVHASSTLTAAFPAARLWQSHCAEALCAAYSTRAREHDDAA